MWLPPTWFRTMGMNTILNSPTGNWIASPSVEIEFAPDFQSFAGTLCTALWFYPLGAGVMPDIEVVPPDGVWGPFPYAMERLPVYVVCP